MIINAKLRPFFILVFFIVGFSLPGFGQGNLMKTVAIGNIKQQRIATVLDIIAGKGDFYFAYNNQAIPADSLVSVAGFNGSLLNLLERLLGSSYEFKEAPGYVVLRHAPNRLYLTAEVVKDKDPGVQLLVKGFVKDATSQKVIRRASVYEKNLLVSTLTDDNGYFEIKLKNYTGSLLLTVTRDTYRDTSLYVLPAVSVTTNPGIGNKTYKYYPGGEGSNGIEHSRFARLFISSKQLVQGLNLGNFFASSPYQISFTPGLSSHGMYNSQVIDHFSLNILGGYTAGIDGFEAAGIFNINRHDVGVVQLAGIFNIVGGNTKGAQFAGVYNNVLNNATGLQVAGILNRTRSFKGAQAAALYNDDDTATGLMMAGLVNNTRGFKGVQLAGLANNTQISTGVQLAGIANRSAGLAGSQLASIFNLATKVKGVQFGLVNIADSSDYTIGLLNFIKNGEKSLALSIDENLFTHFDLRTGGRVLYGIVGIGHKFGTDAINNTLDLGFGAHLVNKPRFYLSAEYVTQLATDFKDAHYQVSSFKILPGYNFSKHIRLFAGPSFNVVSLDGTARANSNGWVLSRNADELPTSTIGITGGLQFVW
jgi:hypothetical protein